MSIAVLTEDGRSEEYDLSDAHGLARFVVDVAINMGFDYCRPGPGRYCMVTLDNALVHRGLMSKSLAKSEEGGR